VVRARKKSTDQDEALRCYSEAIRLKPDFADAFNNRGITRRRKGNLDGAIEDHNEAIWRNPDFGSAFLNRALARKAKGDGKGVSTGFRRSGPPRIQTLSEPVSGSRESGSRCHRADSHRWLSG
jgi:tetratricopeptide (TPR) repeat protein